MTAFALTQFQFKVYNSKERVNLVTPASGCGMTTSLMFKAYKEAMSGKNVTYIVGNKYKIQNQGGLLDQFIKLDCSHDLGLRFSFGSNIVSTPKGKIKFSSSKDPLAATQGVDPDCIIMEHNIKEDVLVYHLFRSKQIFIATHFKEILDSDENHWCQKFGLVKSENGVPYAVDDSVNHITTGHHDAYRFTNYDQYINLFADKSNVELQKLLKYDFKENL